MKIEFAKKNKGNDGLKWSLIKMRKKIVDQVIYTNDYLCFHSNDIFTNKYNSKVMNNQNIEEHLQFIQNFADTISLTFKKFSEICRAHVKKGRENKEGTGDYYTELIKERKRRMQLQQQVKKLMSGQSITENSESKQNEKKKIKNAFTLYVFQVRQKILQDHPSLDIYKITSLAAIKWKKLTQEQRQVYQKKFQDLNKLYEEQGLQEKNNDTLQSDKYLVKHESRPEGQNDQAQLSENRSMNSRQFDYRREEPTEQRQPDYEQPNQEFNQISHTMAPTMIVENEYDIQPTVMMEEGPKNQNISHDEKKEELSLESFLTGKNDAVNNSHTENENKQEKLEESKQNVVIIENTIQN